MATLTQTRRASEKGTGWGFLGIIEVHINSLS